MLGVCCWAGRRCTGGALYLGASVWFGSALTCITWSLDAVGCPVEARVFCRGGGGLTGSGLAAKGNWPPLGDVLDRVAGGGLAIGPGVPFEARVS